MVICAMNYILEMNLVFILPIDPVKSPPVE